MWSSVFLFPTKLDESFVLKWELQSEETYFDNNLFALQGRQMKNRKEGSFEHGRLLAFKVLFDGAFWSSLVNRF